MTGSGSTLFAPENLYCIDYAVRNLPSDDPVVEIGSFSGMSTNMICHYLKKYDRKNALFNADKWELEEKDKDYYTQSIDVTANDFRKFIRDSFIRNLQFFNRNRLPHTIELFSDEFFQKWNSGDELTDVFGRAVKLGGPISFGYVDGNHQYEYVKRDFENIHRYLVKGGFIFFDDSASYFKCGVPAVVEEVKRRKDYEVVMKNPNYLFRRV